MSIMVFVPDAVINSMNLVLHPVILNDTINMPKNDASKYRMLAEHSQGFPSGLFCIRSRSLLKSRRISGRLYEIRVHPIQSLHNGSSQSAGKARTKSLGCFLIDTIC